VRAVVVGSANTDLIMRVNEVPAPGNTAIGGDFRSGPGGKGANQAVCLSRLGVDTSFVGRFGADHFSGILREEIRRCGVEVGSCAVDDRLSGGVVFILVDRRGDNTMILDAGSNAALDGRDVEGAREVFDGADFLLLQFEVSDGANLRACELAKERGIPIVVNPAPMRDFDAAILQYADVLVPNLQELSEMSGRPGGRTGLSDRDRTNPARIGDAARDLSGPSLVVVTLGADGCVAVDEDRIRPYGVFPVEPVDSTAASDAFLAGFALSYARKDPLDDCVAFASGCAAIAVTRPGAIPALPRSEKEVRAFISAHKLSAFGGKHSVSAGGGDK
jgi:ribokinase